MNKLLCVGISIFCLTVSSSSVFAASKQQCDPMPYPNVAFCGAVLEHGTITCFYTLEGRQPYDCATYGSTFGGITQDNLKGNEKWTIGQQLAACGRKSDGRFVPLEGCWWKKQ